MKHSAWGIALSCVLVAGCGGGSSDNNTAPAKPVVVPAAPAFADCYERTPGVKFTTTDKYTHMIVQEMFEGAMAYADVYLRENGTRLAAVYNAFDGKVFTPLGLTQYNEAGVYEDKYVYSKEAALVLNKVPGQAIVLHFTETITRANSLTTEVKTVNDELTFAGFETITVAGRIFANTCKITGASDVQGQLAVGWMAKGFGWIRTEDQSATGTLVAGTRNEIVTIITAP
ncbi:hypothetical protein PO883_03885 [Massilia sp. DJPM01]|uniref:hypothetical protein n=1 Tax=Massilia sp. DJPM01 TaxID=3024404 RepID=UPI00259EED4D|nr:hypothetical protein [Massilia sp. DJPM01]MDM5176330.1 hypothetical protein [Massilia sp. DJPM01]